MRNHRFAGASIPDHEHIQLFPRYAQTPSGERTPHGGLVEAELEGSRYDQGISFVKRSHFDTLAIDKKLLERVFLPLLEQLERDQVTFTFVYFRDSFFLTPHRLPNKKIGGGDPEYLNVVPPTEGFDYDSHVNFLREHIYNRGTFNWDKYLG
jgi:hypothetical protein